jgi:NitT/TauT family transport system substrate-binding protein
MRIFKTLGVAAALSASFGAGPAAADEIKVGVCVSWPGYAMLEIARQQNLLPEHELAITIFEDPLGGHSALAAGQLDVYGCTADYTPIIVDQGFDVVNVAFLNPSFGVDHIILAPDVEENAIAGTKVSAPQAYIGHLLMGMWLDREGVDLGSVEWVNLNADEAVGPMLSGDLAAGYMYEPWISKVLEASPGARSVINTGDPELLKSGIYMDAMYMNTNFIAENREAALAVLKARWDGLSYWNQNVEEANKAMAAFLQWPEEDIGYVIGTDGKSLDGGIYMLDFDESARICGVLDGEPPFEMGNGAMTGTIQTINEWWVKLGLMENTVNAAAGVDCSLMGDLVAAGYRQDLQPN